MYSSKQIDRNDLVYKNDKTLFLVHLVLSTILWLILLISTLGMALVYVLIFFISYLFIQSALIAWLKGNGVKISAVQFPELDEQFNHCCQKLELTHFPEVYLINGGGFLNAFATRFMGRNFVVLYSNIVDAMFDNPDAINFYIGHELGHIQQKHMQWGPYLWPSSLLPLIGAAYSRAREYTCDQYGLVCCEDSKVGVQGLAALAAGDKRWKSIDIPAYLDQVEETSGFWMSFHELVADYPWLTKRAARLNNPHFSAPSRNPFSWLFALFVPRVNGGVGGFVIIIAIIGILAAIAIPAYQDYITRAKQAQVQSEATTKQLPNRMSKLKNNSFSRPEQKQEPSRFPASEQQPQSTSMENKIVNTANTNVPVDELIQNTVSALNQKAPTMIDVYTRLDKATSGPGLKLTFHYTLINIENSDQMPESMFNVTFVPTLKKAACTSSQMKQLLAKNVPVYYNYQGLDGANIGTIKINRVECESA